MALNHYYSTLKDFKTDSLFTFHFFHIELFSLSKPDFRSLEKFTHWYSIFQPFRDRRRWLKVRWQLVCVVALARVIWSIHLLITLDTLREPSKILQSPF